MSTKTVQDFASSTSNIQSIVASGMELAATTLFRVSRFQLWNSDALDGMGESLIVSASFGHLSLTVVEAGLGKVEGLPEIENIFGFPPSPPVPKVAPEFGTPDAPKDTLEYLEVAADSASNEEWSLTSCNRL